MSTNASLSATRFIRLAAAIAVLLSISPRTGAQSVVQHIALKPGWNAIYVEVSPEGDAGAVVSG